MTEPKVVVTVELPAPEDAPLVQGFVHLFKPETLTWRVSATLRGERVAVTAYGPSEHSPGRSGTVVWEYGADHDRAVPDWVPFPEEVVTRAKVALYELVEVAERSLK